MTESVRELINNLLQAITKEYEEEQNIYLQEIRELSAFEREKKGRAITCLRKRSVEQTITGMWLYKFRKKNGAKILDTQFDIGDQVIISQYNPLDSQNPYGTVYEMGERTITIATNGKLGALGSNDVRLDLFVNDLTYNRMKEALVSAKSAKFSRLHAVLSGDYYANSSAEDTGVSGLNDAQLNAVNLAYGCNGFYSIQGPPGTGKTYTTARLIQKLHSQNQKVLVCADSNAAVDNILRQLVGLGLDPLRIGNPIRVNKDLKHYTLDYKIVNSVLYKEIEGARKLMSALKEKQKTLDKPNQKHTKSFTYDELYEIIDKRKGTRGIPRRHLSEMKPWIKCFGSIEKLKLKITALRDQIETELLNSHNIIVTTNVTSGADLLDNYEFDWCIMDEAAQASVPSSLIPLLKSKRFVLVGDHFQLPPVVISEEAKKIGLSDSLMSILAGLYPYALTMLEVQYRMNSHINNLVSSMFYSGKLKCHDSVKTRRLDILKNEDIITKTCIEGHERMNSDSKSYYNDLEALEVKAEVLRLIKKGVEPSQIGVITPYKAQVKHIVSMFNDLIELNEHNKRHSKGEYFDYSKHSEHGAFNKYIFDDIHIDTVDSFQGREKDVIILSLVRSNNVAKIGFLSDFRRLNVSISRAKCRLIIIGNCQMLQTNEMYAKLLSKI